MIVDVAGAPAFVATGGRAFDPEGRVVVLVHGAGMNRTVWRYQSRYLAHHGFSVAAVDLPGHGRSAGPVLATIPAMADWLLDLLDALGVDTASVVGHSMGTYIALEAASTAPERITRLVLLGTGDAIAVHPELLAAADEGDTKAFDLVTSWSVGRPAHLGGHPEPGAWMLGSTLAAFEEEPIEVLAVDLHAVHSYRGAPEAAGKVGRPVLVMVGRDDRMTSPKSATRLVSNLVDAEVAELATGHLMMSEDPAGVARIMEAFLAQ